MTVEMKERVVTRAIIVKNGKVLLGKREHGQGVNKYALIGGKPDEDETLEQCMVREVREEIGLEFTNPVLIRKIFDDESVPGERWWVYFFKGGAEGDLLLKADEVLEVIYVSRRELGEVDIAFNHREILEEFFGLR